MFPPMSVKQIKKEVKELQSNPYRVAIIKNTVIKQISSYNPKFNCKLIIK